MNAKHKDNAQKLKRTMFYYFFSQKTIEQCQNKLKTFQKPWENDSTAPTMKKVQKLRNFTLKTRRSRKKPNAQALKTHLQSSVRSKLPVEA